MSVSECVFDGTFLARCEHAPLTVVFLQVPTGWRRAACELLFLFLYKEKCSERVRLEAFHNGFCRRFADRRGSPKSARSFQLFPARRLV